MDLSTAFAVIVSAEEDEPWRILVMPQGGTRQGARCTGGSQEARCSNYLGGEHDIWHHVDILMPNGSGRYLRAYRPWIGTYLDQWAAQLCADCFRRNCQPVVPAEWEEFDPARHAEMTWRKLPVWEPGGATVVNVGWLGVDDHAVSWICPEGSGIYGPRKEDLEYQVTREERRKRAEEEQRYITNSTQDEATSAAAPVNAAPPRPRDPEPDMPTVLYRWFDADDELLYIGISGSMGNRVRGHERGSSWMAFAVRNTMERYPSRPAAKGAEEDAIKAEHPIFNHQHNDTPEAERRQVEYLISHGRLDLLAPAISRG